jgi:DNA polymerase IV (DinB-like DNA polymerase)
MQRIIIHLDFDSFYASVEENRKPEIRGKPVVICVFSGRTVDSGAVATANYKARELGVKAGMPIMFARRKASEETVFLPYDIEYYREVTDRIMAMLEDECDVLEQASIDEAYMDVSEKSRGSWEAAEAIAARIKQMIREQENLTCSIGIGPNKLMAKMAGKARKPDGLTVVREKDVAEFMEKLPVEKIHGIGTKTVETLHSMKIMTAKELAQCNPLVLEQKFGGNKPQLLMDKAKGVDESPVEPRQAQQISKMKTLKEDSNDPEKIASEMAEMAGYVRKKVEKKNVTFRTVSIILIDTQLGMQTRSETIGQTDDVTNALATAKNLLQKYLNENRGKKIRRLGIRVSNLEYEKKQRSLDDFLQR